MPDVSQPDPRPNSTHRLDHEKERPAEPRPAVGSGQRPRRAGPPAPGAPPEGATGYPWIFFSEPLPWGRWAAMCAVGGLVVLAYILYLRAGLPAGPSNLAGFVCALAGTGCFLCALFFYRLQRRSRAIFRLGQLHTLLQWHFSYGLLSAVLLALHSFGRLDPHFSGTYALFGLLALVGSGYLGRGLDHLLPRLMAREVNVELGGTAPRRVVKLVPLPTASGQTAPNARAAETTDQRRMSFYRSLLAGWRRVHSILAVLTCGLIAWHLVFVLELYLTGQLPVP